MYDESNNIHRVSFTKCCNIVDCLSFLFYTGEKKVHLRQNSIQHNMNCRFCIFPFCIEQYINTVLLFHMKFSLDLKIVNCRYMIDINKTPHRLKKEVFAKVLPPNISKVIHGNINLHEEKMLSISYNFSMKKGNFEML